jgi:hypothetical protein
MAQQKDVDNHEPAIMVRQSKVLWILVFAILWLGYSLQTLPLMIEDILHKEHKELKTIVDHELDDANDNYEESLNLLLQGKGAYDILQAFACDLSQGEVLLKSAEIDSERDGLKQMREMQDGNSGHDHEAGENWLENEKGDH